MHLFLSVVASAFCVALLLWVVQNTTRSTTTTRFQKFMGFALIIAGVALLFSRAFAFAVPLLILGIGLALPKGPSINKTATVRTSQVSSAHLEMTLDHQTGKIDGRVLTGTYEGNLLSGLNLEELLRLRVEIVDDGDSTRLLETFLDRAHPEWRDQSDEEEVAVSGELSREAAYDLLGLEPGASDADVREAYNRLIKRVHPDHGGSDALTAQITEARNRLLGDKS